jgi:hypothetical protein
MKLSMDVVWRCTEEAQLPWTLPPMSQRMRSRRQRTREIVMNRMNPRARSNLPSDANGSQTACRIPPPAMQCGWSASLVPR